MAKSNSLQQIIVGIGASAGGLEALEVFFDHMRSDSGLSFVVVQHLSPNYKSFMAELLSKHTSMTVFQAEHNMKVRPNTIYLIPPKKVLTIQNGTLKLSDTDHTTKLNQPIDRFLESLAQDQKKRAIGVILSGTGSDGSRGIQMIKKLGGSVLVQEQKSAKFDGMPNSAIFTGTADYILPPKQLAEKILEISTPPRGEEFVSMLESGEAPIQQIFDMVRQSSGIDFTYYKQNSILRRVERRMAINQVKTLQDYAQFVKNNPQELSKLRKDLLIGVTQFFRDRDAFDIVLDKVVPKLFDKNGSNEVRVWVAGCSTGEEAYSLAIMFSEYMRVNELTHIVKIFATDLDKDSIDFASQGVYHESATKNIPPELLERYFVREEDTYVIHKDIRKQVIFAPHNIIKDPPFSNLDFISCRNMLIYLQSEIQKKVMSLFHFVLNQDGFLLLGPSESIGKLSSHFETIDRKWNIFQQKTKSRDLQLSDPINQMRMTEKSTQRKAASTSRDPGMYRAADEFYLALMNEHFHPCIVVDDHNDIVHLSGDLTPYLELSKGKPSWNLYKVLDSHFSIAISTAMQKVRQSGEEIVYHAFRVKSRPDLLLNLKIRPLTRKNRSLDKLLLVIFEEVEELVDPVILPSDHFDIPDDVNQRIIQLEQELQWAEQRLQTTTEELETSNEELQATNEELVAANEELQSTNEELQSVNEELVTVNTEYQHKIEELMELNNDMNNFLISTRIGTIFLDKNLCIRRFTPAITREINLLDIDYGRPFAHISHNFKHDLIQDAEEVLRTLVPTEREILSSTGKWYSMRVMPYRTSSNKINGIVFTFVDITELKQAYEELVKFSYLIEQSPSNKVILDMDGNIEYANPKFVALSGYPSSELIGRNIQLFNQWGKDEPDFDEIWSQLKKGQSWSGELEGRKKDGTAFWESVRMLPIHNKEGKVVHYLKVSEDITNLKQTEELLRKSEMLSGIGQLAAGIAHEIRNPLTALKGFTQLMSSGVVNEKYISIMRTELNRIEEIVSELLVLSKPQAVDYYEKDVLSILKDVIMLLDTQAIMNKVEIKLDTMLDIATVSCVENQLKQVFINVTQNAIEAMPNGGEIHVSVREVGRQYQIDIRDTGSGIAQENLPRIGEPFFSTKEKGTGLGLMVSYKIIEHHQGKFFITSKMNEGTTVHVRLPKA